MSARSVSRSLGVKLILVAILTLLMGVPALFAYALVWDRSNRAEQVMNEVAWDAGGQQVIYGPMLLVPVLEPIVRAQAAQGTGGVNPETGMPYERAAPAGAGLDFQRRVIVFFPEMLAVEADMAVEERSRSIFKVPVYVTTAKIDLRFGALEPPPLLPGTQILWDEARLALGLTDVRGIKSDVAFEIGGTGSAIGFEPGLGEAAAGQSFPAAISAPLKGAFQVGRPFDIKLSLALGGGRTLRFTAVGRESRITLTSNWPHPAFQGNFLTQENEVTAEGFRGFWQIPYLARNLPQALFAEQLHYNALQSTELGVDLVLPGSPYQRVTRALKYALMFVGFVFLGFFLFEAMSGRRVHAAQYLLVGMAQVIFYLLLLSIAEHRGFNEAYVAAAGATVALTGVYAGFSFGLLRGIAALIFFAAIYGLLYILMREEDYALLIGSVTAFLAVALAMILTRNVDWYGESEESDGGQRRNERMEWSS